MSDPSKVVLANHRPEITPEPGTAKGDIIELLYRNDEHGYQPQAVQNALDLPYGFTTRTLRRLYQDGHIGQTDDGYYHALHDHEGLYRHIGALDQLDRMFNTQTPSPSPDTDTEHPLDEGIAAAERNDTASVDDILETIGEGLSGDQIDD